MDQSILTTTNQIKRGLTPKLARLKRTMRRHRVSAWDVAIATGVSDAYVWMVLNGRRRSPRIMETVERLVAERKSAISNKSTI